MDAVRCATLFRTVPQDEIGKIKEPGVVRGIRTRETLGAMRYIAITLTLLTACDKESAHEDALARVRLVAHTGPFTEIDLPTVLRRYDENPMSADSEYKLKAVRFTAAVSNIIKDKDGEPLVFFGPDEDHNLIGCGGMIPGVVRLTRRGQVRTMHGVFMGQFGRVPMVMFCEME